MRKIDYEIINSRIELYERENELKGTKAKYLRDNPCFAFCIIAKHQDQVCGSAFIINEKRADHLKIDWIKTEPHFQRSPEKVGANMLRLFKETAISEGYSSFEFVADNEIADFYTGAGFEVIKREKHISRFQGNFKKPASRLKIARTPSLENLHADLCLC